MSKNILTIEVEIIKEPDEWVEPDEEKWGSNEMMRKGKRVGMIPEIAEHYLELGVVRLVESTKDVDKTYNPLENKEDLSNNYLVSLLTKHKKPLTQKCVHMTAKRLIRDHSFKTVYGDKDNEIYIYKDGIYANKGRKIIKEDIEKIFTSHISNHFVNEIVSKIERMTFIERKDLECQDKKLINVANGVIDLNNVGNGVFELKDIKLLSHSPNLPFLSKINTTYNPSSKCPRIMNFLNEMCYPEDIKVLQEWTGFQLYRDYFIKKALGIVGEKNTGKTTWANINMKFIGDENISGISLQDIASNRFAIADLYGKHLNICDDLSEADIEDVGRFKSLAGNSRGNCAEFKFGNKFIFWNHAKFMYTCNKIPSPKREIAKNDDAYYDRWMWLRFDNVVEGNDVNAFLVDDMCSSEEMSGMLNWALEGLLRLLKNPHFSYNRNCEETKKLMLASGSPIASFLYNKTSPEIGKWISKQELYDAFVDYCIKEKLQVMGIERFGRNLPKIDSNIVDKTHNGVRGWANISLGGLFI